MKKLAAIFGLAFMIGLIAGCGGGDSGSSSPVATQGLYTGSTGTGRAFSGLVLDDGTYYFLYSATGNSNVVAGVVQGTGSASGSMFTSSNARDFNLEGIGVLPATISATYVTKQSLSGTVSYSQGGPTSFSGIYDASYENTPSLSALAGNFSGQVVSSAGAETANITVTSTGSVSGSGSSGCNASGTVTPRSQGNAFNVSLSFGASPCLFANQTLFGIAYFNASTKVLYVVTPNGARTDGVLFFGSKP